MRKFIPIFVAAALFVGCKSATMSTTSSTTSTNAVAPPPVPNTPAQTMTENHRLGEFGAAFIVILTVLAVKKS
jgi:hypothetical protein